MHILRNWICWCGLLSLLSHPLLLSAFIPCQLGTAPKHPHPSPPIHHPDRWDKWYSWLFLFRWRHHGREGGILSYHIILHIITQFIKTQKKSGTQRNNDVHTKWKCTQRMTIKYSIWGDGWQFKGNRVTETYHNPRSFVLLKSIEASTRKKYYSSEQIE